MCPSNYLSKYPSLSGNKWPAASSQPSNRPTFNMTFIENNKKRLEIAETSKRMNLKINTGNYYKNTQLWTKIAKRNFNKKNYMYKNEFFALAK